MEIALQVRGNYQEVLEAALWAERKGLAAFALPDHYLASPENSALPAWDHVVHLAGLARETETIELVDLVSPVTFRHPAVHAKMAVTIRDMARRTHTEHRFVMGLGTGWMDSEHHLFGFRYPDMKERYEMLTEQLASHRPPQQNRLCRQPLQAGGI